MSNWKELDKAVEILKDCELTLFQCSSIYPCPPEKVGLNIISEMKKRYKCKIGFSDHTNGMAASISAAALGADVIEKHFTFSRYMYGSDAKNSMEPQQFSLFCEEIKNVWAMLENPVDKNNLNTYKEMKIIYQKSIVSACDIPEGEVIEMKHLAFKKPGSGISAADYKNIIGRITKSKIKKDTIIKKSLLR